MENKNPIRTFRDYYIPRHEGYQNTIELPDGNNVVPLRSDTIRLVQNECSFHELRTPKKVLVKEETGNPITKNINVISLIKIEKEKGVEGGKVAEGNVTELNELEALEPIELPEKEEEIEEGT
nr:MAK10-like protein [Tanacetum cinerariifolium]